MWTESPGPTYGGGHRRPSDADRGQEGTAAHAHRRQPVIRPQRVPAARTRVCIPAPLANAAVTSSGVDDLRHLPLSVRHGLVDAQPADDGDGRLQHPVACAAGRVQPLLARLPLVDRRGPGAIDTTGVHILGTKVRGKLLTLPEPRIALVTQGHVTEDLDTVSNGAGWTLVLPGATKPRRIQFADLGAVLEALRME